jgi:LmbE family N-acetylglucosaminyl deacetylase
MPVLIVVAHPDDEVLGCGGTAAGIAAAGHSVRACFMSGHAAARGNRPTDEQLVADAEAAQALLGFGSPIFGDFPNIRLNSVPHLDLVRFIERALEETQADVVFTHHPCDLNDDHVQVSRATQAAARLWQRGAKVPSLRRLFFMEIPSSTDWALDPSRRDFRPDTFVEIGERLELKLAALAKYRGVMRPYPHPRSEEVIRALATLRGAQAGLRGAEAFQTGFAAGSATDLVR